MATKQPISQSSTVSDRVMIADLETTIARAKAQYRADRIAAARDRVAGAGDHSPLAVRF